MATKKRRYDPDIAERLGLNAAIIFEFIVYWCSKSKNIRDGSRWIFYRLTDFEEHFPDMSRSTIRRCLKKLEQEGYIKTACFNKLRFDHTKWYAVNNEHIEEVKMPTSKCSKRTHRDVQNEHIRSVQNEHIRSVQNEHNNNNYITTKETTKEIVSSGKKRFIPPSVDEVRAYCDERHNGIDPEHFIDFYAAKGWMIGKNKMKDWRAAVRNWERKDKEAKTSSKTVRQEGNEFDQLLREEGYIS